MAEIVSVRFRQKGKSYYFDPGSLTLHTGDKVIVETAKGLEIGETSQVNHQIEDEKLVAPLRQVVRVATEEDLRTEQKCRDKEREAFQVAQKGIKAHGLDMKLVDVECSFEGNKIVFFFSSDGRVDFRELVKDLAGVFHTRIELRQIGVRDEARMMGGLGICGRPYCCGTFMEEFKPVSTKMAKVQNLSLNPTKISGSCGRLMCCLRYEQPAYDELVKNVPKVGAFVETPEGYGNVNQVNILRQTVRVKMDGEEDNAYRQFDVEEVAVVPGGRPKDGTPPAHVLEIKPKEKEQQEQEDPWAIPDLLIAGPGQNSAQMPAKGKAGAKDTKKESRDKSGKNRREGKKESKATAGNKQAPKSNQKQTGRQSQPNERKAGAKQGNLKAAAGSQNSSSPMKGKPSGTASSKSGKNVSENMGKGKAAQEQNQKSQKVQKTQSKNYYKRRRPNNRRPKTEGSSKPKPGSDPS